MAGPIRYEGRDSGGTPRRGTVFTSDVPMFVAQHYTRDWETLDLWQSQRKVGEIRRYTGWASWWAFKDDGDMTGMCKFTLEDAPLD